jgi:hypothetical protein
MYMIGQLLADWCKDATSRPHGCLLAACPKFVPDARRMLINALGEGDEPHPAAYATITTACAMIRYCSVAIVTIMKQNVKDVEKCAHPRRPDAAMRV